MEEIKKHIASWPCLANGLHYKWLVDYPVYSAFGTYELSSEEWENRDYIQNFKGNSELTTEADHQQAQAKAISQVSEFITENFGEEAKEMHLLCIPAAKVEDTKRRFKVFSEKVCEKTGMKNAYGEDETNLKGKKILVFDDIIASGGSVTRFAEKLGDMGAEVIAALALGKKISDGYDQ